MSIDVELVPFLTQLRELYSQPRGFARFKEYLDILRSQTGEMELPISNVNPMAKPQVLEYVEQLIALDAESEALQAARDGARRFDGVDDALRLIVIVADDAQGGWTNRYFTEFAHRYERKHEVARGWATVMLWSSEQPSPNLVRTRALETLYRTVDERAHGPVRTLREILDREMRTQRFAGTTSRYEEPAYRSKVEPYLDSRAAPIVFAALYGDAAAESLGYPPLGIPESERGPLARSPLV
ncbi:MAG TPA: hypothetical protein VMF11_05100 [Candidatus Baltobacteraceae bacterium]|nr:hypothetical protein [Candidatus Baltobacteraceae bacterium]